MFAALAVLAGALVLMAGIILILGLLRGWVLTYLWSWFIVPLFHLPEINVLQAWGLSIVVSFLTYEFAYTGPKEEAKSKMFTVLLSPFVALLGGYLIHLYM